MQVIWWREARGVFLPVAGTARPDMGLVLSWNARVATRLPLPADATTSAGWPVVVTRKNERGRTAYHGEGQRIEQAPERAHSCLAGRVL